MPKITRAECGRPGIETHVCLDERQTSNHYFCPSRVFSFLSSPFPRVCVPTTLGLRGREVGTARAFHSGEVDAGGAEHTVCRGLEAEFPSQVPPLRPRTRSAHSWNFAHYLVQGRLRGQLQGHWLHGAPLSQDVLEAPLGMREGLWGPGIAPSQTTGDQLATLRKPS